MTVEHFRDTMKATPLRPFTVHVADGRLFTVKHPEHVASSRSGRTVIIFGEDDGFSILDCLLMMEVQVHDPARGEAA